MRAARHHDIQPSPGHGVGLASVEQRIEEMTDGAGSLATSVVDGRFEALIRLPGQTERRG